MAGSKHSIEHSDEPPPAKVCLFLPCDENAKLILHNAHQRKGQETEPLEDYSRMWTAPLETNTKVTSGIMPLELHHYVASIHCTLHHGGYVASTHCTMGACG